MSETDQDRVHPATPSRFAQARQDGNIAKSQELAVAIQLGMVLLAIYLLANGFVVQLSRFATEVWSDKLIGQYGVQEFQDQLSRVAVCLAGMLVPFLLVVVMVTVMSHLIQSGPMFQSDRVVPDASRLSPGPWFQRVFSLANVARAVLGLPKMLVAVSVASAVFWMQRDAVMSLGTLDIGQMASQLTRVILAVSGCVALALLATSLFDYILERASHQQRLRMTEQQLRDQQRMNSVDPQIANRRRQFHQDLGSR